MQKKLFVEDIASKFCKSCDDGITPIPASKTVKFRKLMAYTDLRIDTVKKLSEIAESLITTDACETEEQAQKNILTLVKLIGSEKNFGVDAFLDVDSEYSKGAKKLLPEENYKEFKKVFSSMWSKIMKWKMSPSVYKMVITLLPDKIMPHLTKPLHMSDFLMEAFKLGGAFSIISLHGLFLLMQSYNFEVPDFYQKLYNMLNVKLMWSNHRDRYFAYTSTFLSSSHLPEYLVGAFVKRISRLTLHSPSHVIPMMCCFIVNMLIRHPGIQNLIGQKSSKIKNLKEDPFIFEETDPSACRAMETNLWEIKTLQQHAITAVAEAAGFLEKPIPKMEKDIGEYLSSSYEDILRSNDEQSDITELVYEEDLETLTKKCDQHLNSVLEHEENSLKRRQDSETEHRNDEPKTKMNKK